MGFTHLRVYQAACELRSEVDGIIRGLPPGARGGCGNTLKHLVEAVDSIKHNISEGNDSVYPRKKASFFDIAAGSCREARSALQSLVERGVLSHKQATRAIGLTYVIAKMLHAMRLG